MMTDAFGVVALVALAPLLVIQTMGLLYNLRLARTAVGAGVMTPEEAGRVVFYESEDW
jgi:hypothetical protein